MNATVSLGDHLLAGGEGASEAVRRLCAQLCKMLSAERVSVWLFDAACETVSPFMHDGRDEGLHDRSMRWMGFPTAEFGLVQELLADGRAVVVDDARTDPRLPPGLADDFGVTSARCELLVAGRPVGLLGVEPASAGADPALTDMARVVAASAGLAQAWQEAARGRADAEFLLEIVEGLRPEQGLAEMLSSLCIALARRLRVDRACVFLYEAGKLVPKTAQLASGEANQEAWHAFRSAPEPLGLVEEVVRTRAPVVVSGPDSPLVAGWWATTFDLVSGFGVPVGGAPEVMGVLTLDSRVPQRFTRDQVRLATAAGRHLGSVVARGRTAEDRAENLRTTEAARRLLEEGASAASVEEAGLVVARVARDALRTEHAAVYLGDVTTRLITHVLAIGVNDEWIAFLRDYCVGQVADDFLLWRLTASRPDPILVADARSSELLPADLVRTLGLGSYATLPLLSAEGPLGLVVCSTPGVTRHWRPEDERVARQLALEGSLVIDNARLRAAERQRLDQLAHQAFHDLLTGLPNRALLFDRLDHAMAVGRRTGAPVTLVLLDIDEFKVVNDTFGHLHGDELLRAFAERLHGSVRECDTVARLGGDEFAVLVTDGAGRDVVGRLVDRLTRSLEAPFDVDGGKLRMSASIGVAQCPDDANDLDGLYHRADRAMYASKAARTYRSSRHEQGAAPR